MSREFASRPGRAPVQIQIALRSANASFVGTSKNIGVGGLFVATDHRLSVGDRFTVELSLPDHVRPMSVEAEVRWIRNADDEQSGAGLRFLNPSIGAMVALYDVLRKIDEERSTSS